MEVGNQDHHPQWRGAWAGAGAGAGAYTSECTLYTEGALLEGTDDNFDKEGDRDVCDCHCEGTHHCNHSKGTLRCHTIRWGNLVNRQLLKLVWQQRLSVSTRQHSLKRVPQLPLSHSVTQTHTVSLKLRPWITVAESVTSDSVRDCAVCRTVRLKYLSQKQFRNTQLLCSLVWSTQHINNIFIIRALCLEVLSSSHKSISSITQYSLPTKQSRFDFASSTLQSYLQTIKPPWILRI